jgi:hypothetical protein
MNVMCRWRGHDFAADKTRKIMASSNCNPEGLNQFVWPRNACTQACVNFISDPYATDTAYGNSVVSTALAKFASRKSAEGMLQYSYCHTVTGAWMQRHGAFALQLWPEVCVTVGRMPGHLIFP